MDPYYYDSNNCVSYDSYGQLVRPLQNAGYYHSQRSSYDPSTQPCSAQGQRSSYDPSQHPCSAQGQRSSYGARPSCSFQDQGTSYPGNVSSLYNGVRQDVSTYAAQCQQPLSDGSLYNTNRSMDNSSGSLNYGGLYNSDGSLYSGYGPVHRMEGSFQNMQDHIDWNADRGMNSNGSLRNINGFCGNYSTCAQQDRPMAPQLQPNTMTSQSFHPTSNSIQHPTIVCSSSSSNRVPPRDLTYSRVSNLESSYYPMQQTSDLHATLNGPIWNADSRSEGIKYPDGSHRLMDPANLRPTNSGQLAPSTSRANQQQPQHLSIASISSSRLHTAPDKHPSQHHNPGNILIQCSNWRGGWGVEPPPPTSTFKTYYFSKNIDPTDEIPWLPPPTSPSDKSTTVLICVQISWNKSYTMPILII